MRISRSFFILVSILIHLFLFLLMGWSRSWTSIKGPQEVEVTILQSPHQIADIAPPEKEERPDASKFVGLYDSRVKEEKVAPTRHRSRSSSPEENKPQENKEGKKLAAKRPEPSRMAGGESDLFDSGLPEDYFHDYKIGDHTYLNVFKYPKVAYFVRLKKVFRTRWNPVPALRASMMTAQVSRGQVEVVLGVTVDPTGKLAELQMIRSSGLPLYDQEALQTIRDSSPFASPPAELLDNTQKLRMAWTFTVYL